MSDLLFIGSRTVNGSATIDLVKLDNVDTIPVVTLLKALYIKIGLIDNNSDTEEDKNRKIKILEKQFHYFSGDNPQTLQQCNFARLDIEELYESIKVIDNNLNEVDIFKWYKE